MPIFDKLSSQDEVSKVVRRADISPVGRRGDRRALDIIENRQRVHTQSELRRRFPRAQRGRPGQEIMPVTINIAQKYVSEAANAYNKSVTYRLVDENGNDAPDELTSQLNRALGYRYQEAMHSNERLTVALDTAELWYQARRKTVRPVHVLPGDVHPVLPKSKAFFSRTDPDDYDGFVVELHGSTREKATGGGQRDFCLLTNAQQIFYSGMRPDQVAEVHSYHDVPYMWEQVWDEYDEATDSFKMEEGEKPLQMLTFWHRDDQIGELIPSGDSTIADANIELNVMWSVLFDTIRFQGFSQIVLGLANRNSPKARMAWGPRFPLVLQGGGIESADMLSAAPSYSQQVETLQAFVKLLAVAQRMSPADFATDAERYSSGFAKLVDSLPKIEAREERLRRLTYMEEEVAWPRIAAILTHNDVLDKAALNYRLKVEFDGVHFPMAEDERTTRHEFDLKHNLTTPAKILAFEKGITVKEAEKEIAENAEKNASMKPRGEEGGEGFGLGGGRLFGNLIQQPRRRGRGETEDSDTGGGDAQPPS